MTGAGSGTVYYAIEDSYGELPTDPTWFSPGLDIEVGSASLDRALTRARKQGDPRPKESREGNREGAFSVTHTITDTNWHDLVFADGGTALASGPMLAPTATWFLAAETLPGSVTRPVTGAATESVSLNWQQGEAPTLEQTIIYGDEDASITAPSSPTEPSEGDSVAFHSSDLEISGTSVSKLQSFSLDISGMARFDRGQQQTPIDAVVGAYQPSLSVQAIFEDGTRKDLVYGSSSATTPQDEMDTSTGTIPLSNAAGSVATYNLSGLKPTSYDWSDLISADTSATDPTEFHVTDVQVA